MEKTLFEKLGGESAVNIAVDIFYNRILADDRIKHFFANTDMEKQRHHQKRFLTYVFGGSNQYDGKNMRAAHSRLVKEKGLNDNHFDIVVGHLGGTLLGLGVAEDLVKEVARIAETVRNDVLNR
ncbi:MAG: group 1 truncated hemoglobin [Beggiatoa sp. IS2]|nr:MAG: group 1 truncated hemoglobin [Beggiatoa sp. IS2]